MLICCILCVWCLISSRGGAEPSSCWHRPVRLWLKPSACVSNTSCPPLFWLMPPSTCWSVTASLTLQWQVNISPCFRYCASDPNVHCYYSLVHCTTACRVSCSRSVAATQSQLLYPNIIFTYLIGFSRISSLTIILAMINSSFIHLLFYSQSSCAVTTMAEVLSCACAGTSMSQLASLFSLHRKLLISREERPSSMLKGAVDSLSSFFKVQGHQHCPPYPHLWFMNPVILSLVNSLDWGRDTGAVMAFALNAQKDFQKYWSCKHTSPFYSTACTVVCSESLQSALCLSVGDGLI